MLSKLLKKYFFRYISDEEILQKAEQALIKRAQSQVVIGNNSAFYPESLVQNLKNDKNNIVVGSNTHIRGELTVYPYSKKLLIGDNCYLGQGSIIRVGESITIGNNVLIAHNVTIIDSDSHEINASERAESYVQMLKFGHPKTKGNVKTSPIIIEDNVWISYNVCILKGVKIGNGAIIAAGSVVTKDVLPFSLYAGNPAQFIKTIKND